MSAVSEWVERRVLPEEGDQGWWPDTRRLVVRTVLDTFDDRVPGLAAEMAFYVVLSLPPLLLVILGSVGFVVGDLPDSDLVRIQESIVSALSTFLSPGTVEDVLEEPIRQLLREGRSDVLSLGIVLTLWSASRSTNVLLRTVIIAYDLEDHRPVWKRRLLALGLTLAGVALAIVVLPTLVIGPDVARELFALVGLAPDVAAVWPVVYWAGVVVVALAALTWTYHVAPAWHTPWRRDLPGAVLALVVWLGASAAIRVYTAELAGFSTNETFAGLAAPLVLLLWIYASGIAVLLGAELNAEIERLWPTPDGPYADDSGNVTSPRRRRRWSRSADGHTQARTDDVGDAGGGESQEQGAAPGSEESRAGDQGGGDPEPEQPHRSAGEAHEDRGGAGEEEERHDGDDGAEGEEEEGGDRRFPR